MALSCGQPPLILVVLRTPVDSGNNPLTVTGKLGQSVTICTSFMDRSWTVQGREGQKQHPVADNPLMVIGGSSGDCLGTIHGLLTNRTN